MPRGLIVLLGIAGAVVAVAGIKAVASIVGPVFLALILTISVHRLPAALRRSGWPVWAAFLVTVLLVYGIIIGIFVALVFAVARLATLLPDYAGRFDALIDRFTAFLHEHGIATGTSEKLLSGLDAHTVLNGVGAVLQGTLGVTSTFVFLVVLLLFMAADAMNFPDRLSVVTRHRPDIAGALTRFAVGTRSYLMVSTVFGLIVAVLDSLALWALAIPLPILWGLLSFITNYIPNIGFIIGLVPPALLALLDAGWEKILLVILVYSVINVVIQSFIQPKFVGDAVDLSLTLTFLSLAFWTWVIGPLGAILAIPLTLFAKALLVDVDPTTRWMNALLTMRVPDDDGPPPTASATGWTTGKGIGDRGAVGGGRRPDGRRRPGTVRQSASSSRVTTTLIGVGCLGGVLAPQALAAADSRLADRRRRTHRRRTSRGRAPRRHRSRRTSEPACAQAWW